jgi:hypothetical protein
MFFRVRYRFLDTNLPKLWDKIPPSAEKNLESTRLCLIRLGKTSKFRKNDQILT